jgi:hypothetical protein
MPALAVGEEAGLVHFDERIDAVRRADEEVVLPVCKVAQPLVRIHPGNLQVRRVDDVQLQLALAVCAWPPEQFDEQEAVGRDVTCRRLDRPLPLPGRSARE